MFPHGFKSTSGYYLLRMYKVGWGRLFMGKSIFWHAGDPPFRPPARGGRELSLARPWSPPASLGIVGT